MMETCCPVCFEDFKRTRPAGPVEDALSCKNQHRVCVRCIQKMVEPTRTCRKLCSGLHYACPLCRTPKCLNDIDVLVVVKGTFTDAGECFSNTSDMWEWKEQRTSVY